MRILFPHEGAARYCRQFDLANQSHRKQVRDHILPRMIANKEEILRDPTQLAFIMTREENQQRQAVVVAKQAAAVAAMPVHQSEIIMYGERFWPNPHQEMFAYTYDQARAACWYFTETNLQYEISKDGDSAKSRAVMMKFSTRWFSQYADREIADVESKRRIKNVFKLIHHMAHAMERNPDGVCKRPPSPTNDGEWP